MSQHSSLKGASVSKKHRNVLKRFERIKKMKDNETWEERGSIYNLPKIKMIKLKVKKEKASPTGEGEAAEGAAAEAGDLTKAAEAGKEVGKKDAGKKK